MPVVPDAVTIVILAAGGGARLGGGKLLLPWRGRPILAHTLSAAAAVRRAREIVVVTGCDGERVRAAVEAASTPAMPPVRTLDNAEWADGQSTSLRRAITAVMDGPATGGAMIMLGDQPLVRPDTLNLLADSHAARLADTPEHPATVPSCDGQRGNPVILSPCLYPSVLRLDGDVGARHILASLGAKLLTVPVSDPGVLRDVDTPDDYAALQRG